MWSSSSTTSAACSPGSVSCSFFFFHMLRPLELPLGGGSGGGGGGLGTGMSPGSSAKSSDIRLVLPQLLPCPWSGYLRFNASLFATGISKWPEISILNCVFIRLSKVAAIVTKYIKSYFHMSRIEDEIKLYYIYKIKLKRTKISLTENDMSCENGR